VKFEDLILKPEAEMARLFSEAGLTNPDIETVENGLRINGTFFEVRTDLNNVHLKRFTGNQNPEIKDITVGLMKEFEY